MASQYYKKEIDQRIDEYRFKKYDDQTELFRTNHFFAPNIYANRNAYDGSQYDMLNPSINGPCHYIFMTPPILKMYIESASKGAETSLEMTLASMTRGMSLIGLREGGFSLSSDLIIAKEMMTQNSLSFLSNSLQNDINPPEAVSKILETLSWNYDRDLKMGQRQVESLTAGMGSFNTIHREYFHDYIETYFNMVKNFIRYKNTESYIKIAPEYQEPPQQVETASVWQIFTKENGYAISNLVKYTGCTPGIPKVNHPEGKVNSIRSVSCEWSYIWADEISLELIITFNLMMARYNVKVNLGHTGYIIRKRIWPEMETVPDESVLHAAIMPYEHKHAGIIEWVLTYATFEEWMGAITKYHNEKTIRDFVKSFF